MKSMRNRLPGRLKKRHLALALAVISGAALAQVEVRNPTVAGGGGTVESGPYRLTGTLGEAGQGTVTAGEVRLTSGFPATIPDPPPLTDGIFSDDFEG